MYSSLEKACDICWSSFPVEHKIYPNRTGETKNQTNLNCTFFNSMTMGFIM